MKHTLVLLGQLHIEFDVFDPDVLSLLTVLYSNDINVQQLLRWASFAAGDAVGPSCLKVKGFST